mmetsp:Transcript_26135/g.38685  ORF Transcript_26135/g.38685 Transcript_26135/m.38685 type:complete len:251 (-) Transcript_26135:147-899(-)
MAIALTQMKRRRCNSSTPIRVYGSKVGPSSSSSFSIGVDHSLSHSSLSSSARPSFFSQLPCPLFFQGTFFFCGDFRTALPVKSGLGAVSKDSRRRKEELLTSFPLLGDMFGSKNHKSSASGESSCKSALKSRLESSELCMEPYSLAIFPFESCLTVKFSFLAGGPADNLEMVDKSSLPSRNELNLIAPTASASSPCLDSANRLTFSTCFLNARRKRSDCSCVLTSNAWRIMPPSPLLLGWAPPPPPEDPE